MIVKYYFTFGGDHKLAGYCQPIEAQDYYAARAKMFELYRAKWGFQYLEGDWLKIKNDPKRKWPLEQELPTIEA